MNNKTVLLSLIFFVGMSMHALAFAAGPNIDGFLDLTYVLSDGQAAGVSPVESKFNASGELDYKASLGGNAEVRLDTDLNMTAGSGGLSLEQAFIDIKTANGLLIKGGLFNNPVGWEAEDAPDMYQISHTQIFNILDASTFQNTGNNVIGLSVTGDMGAISLTGGILNDLGEVNEESSFMGVATLKSIENLVLEVGIETQDANLETLIDINGTFSQGPLTVGGEILLPGELIDLGFGVTAAYKFAEKLSGSVHFSNVSYDVPAGADDTTSLIFAASYAFASNVFMNAEIRIDDNTNVVALPVPAIGDGDLITLELVATF